MRHNEEAQTKYNLVVLIFNYFLFTNLWLASYIFSQIVCGKKKVTKYDDRLAVK